MTKTNISLFDTLQQIRSQQHNHQQSLLASYPQKNQTKAPKITGFDAVCAGQPLTLSRRYKDELRANFRPG